MINTMAIKNKFMGANKKSYGVMDSMILAGIPIAICYWFLESILQIFFSGKYNFIAVFFGPDLYQIYTRVTVLCLFFIFGSHAQNIINKIRDTREELHESEEKYRTVADFTYDWEYWIGEKGNFEYVSPSCERISGYRADAFLKNPGLLNQIIHPVDRDEVSDHFRTELVISDPLLLVGQDMTARMINRAAAENYGLNKEQIATGRFCYVATGQSDPDRKNEIPAAVAHGRNLTLERHNFVNPGRIEQVVIYPFRKKSGGNDGAIIRIADITAAKQFERRFIQSEKMASLGVLVSSIAHEINNPNNFISFNIPILREYIDELIEIADRHTANQPKLELFHMSYPDFRQDLFKLLENIEHGADRIDAYVKNLREFYRGKDNHG